MTSPKPSLKQRVRHGMTEYLLITLYLWVFFALFTVQKSIVLAEQNIDFAPHGFALINALALAKVILIAQDFHFGDRFKDEPLLYPILFRSAVFTILLGCFKFLEEIAVDAFHGKPVNLSITAIGGGTVKGTLFVTVLMFILLIPFFCFAELKRVLGEDKLETMLFRSSQSANPNFSLEKK
jgi:hypothetical protein